MHIAVLGLISVLGAGPADAGAEAEAEAVPLIEPDAVGALEKMSAFLRGQKMLTVKAVTETDDVLDTGQKVTLTSTATVAVKRPNRLRAEMKSERKQRQFYFDGKSFTLFSPRIGYYSTVAAPATLGELVDVLSERYDIEMPLVDLYTFGEDSEATQRLTAAMYVGPSEVGGKLCDQFAFRQPDLDWQVWIQRGQEPLPLKLVLTTTSDPARPQHSAVYSWTLGEPKGGDAQYRFVPPKNAHAIELLDLSTAKPTN